ncbi:MAG: hypothetical protein HYX21_03765 [Candidatus Yanofskybacteria bacterium]|nr:hypothetical protein [Candidatus Yanofskybacteria bacterium]
MFYLLKRRKSFIRATFQFCLRPLRRWKVFLSTTKLKSKIKNDILISGVGKAGLITENMVKEGAVVIDFGPDVDFESVNKKASLITPPVGGVGPIVIAAVLKNLKTLPEDSPQ